MTEHSRATLSRIARGLFRQGNWALRFIQGYRPLLCPFEALIKVVPDQARVLDVGCGGGLFLALLAATGRISEGVGFDASRMAIEVAQRLGPNLPAGHRIRFEQRGVDEPWPNEVFDVVSIVDLMHHVPPTEQESLLVKAAHHVAPGGMLLYKDVSKGPAWRAWASRLHDLVIARQWIHIVPFASVVRWAEAAGLETERHHRIDVLWYGHELGVFRRPAGNHPLVFP